MCVIDVDPKIEKVCQSIRMKNNRIFRVFEDVGNIYLPSNKENTLFTEDEVEIDDSAT